MLNIAHLYKNRIGKYTQTDTLMVIESIEKYKDSVLYNCLVLTQDENEEEYFANASYSPEEILLLNKTVEEMLLDIRTKKGIQLNLF